MIRSVASGALAVLLLASLQAHGASPAEGTPTSESTGALVASPCRCPEYDFDLAGTLWATGAAVLIGAPAGLFFFVGSMADWSRPALPMLVIPVLAPWVALLIADLARARLDDGDHAWSTTGFSLLGATLGGLAGALSWWTVPPGTHLALPVILQALLPLIGSVTGHEWSRAAAVSSRQQRQLMALPFVDPLGATRNAQGVTLAMAF